MRHDDALDKPGSPGFRIKDMHAFIAIDPRDDSEGIVSRIDGRTGLHEPLIGADQARIESHRPYAEEVARATGTPIKLVRFSVREDVETFQ